jgi:hypothetical protein
MIGIGNRLFPGVFGKTKKPPGGNLVGYMVEDVPGLPTDNIGNIAVGYPVGPYTPVGGAFPEYQVPEVGYKNIFLRFNDIVHGSTLR